MKRAVLIFRARLHQNHTRPGVPLFHVAKALGHTSIETTMRHYANLAPGAAKEMPNVLDRFVFGDPAGNHVNRTQTTEVAAEVSKTGGA